MQRTPLHVDFGPTYDRAERLKGIRGYKRFNAIGSLCVGTNMHLPVLDTDGGTKITHYRDKVKAVLTPLYVGMYTPESNLKELLADHYIDAEVFQEYDRHYAKNRVSALVLRASAGQTPVFEVFDSTIRKNGHLYINTPFSDGDHAELLHELEQLGIVRERWTSMAEKDGMGVVRTPWTEKKLSPSWGS